MPYVLTIAGFIALFAGGELLVRGAVTVSRRMGIPPLLVGLTVVAFCTSAPELLVSLRAAFAGNPDIAVGNVVGSNTANVALILGAAALVSPLVFDRREIRSDAFVALGASLLLIPLGLLGRIPSWLGALLVASLVVYLVLSYRAAVSRGQVDSDWHAGEAAEFKSADSWAAALAFLGGGLLALVLGADWLIDGAREIASSVGVPDAVVGLTVVAVGTSLPELATSIMAARRGHADVAVGNVLGSNTFNVLSILGTTAIVAPLSIAPSMARFDIPVMALFALTAIGALLLRGKVGRPFGLALIVAYLAYVAYLYLPMG
jgi:cation:H+ antiporter